LWIKPNGRKSRMACTSPGGGASNVTSPNWVAIVFMVYVSAFLMRPSRPSRRNILGEQRVRGKLKMFWWPHASGAAVPSGSGRNVLATLERQRLDWVGGKEHAFPVPSLEAKLIDWPTRFAPVRPGLSSNQNWLHLEPFWHLGCTRGALLIICQTRRIRFNCAGAGFYFQTKRTRPASPSIGCWFPVGAARHGSSSSGTALSAPAAA
jgi:hypothetical protein